ncbi:MAG: polysaccharide deacetylase family protein [Chitinophagaceae bacterium]|nr:polysaccharide deacetylase family protein [Chitinophagaceae bacterium]
MLYPVLTPWILKKLYPDCLWEMPPAGKELYLTFDDGPEPSVTPFVLDQLKDAGFRGTFFCIGKNVEANPSIFKRILDEGHAVGNHTQNHLSGWRVTDQQYIDDVLQASSLISSKLFRPPYGRASRAQMRLLMQSPHHMKIVMWSLLSGDFDPRRTAEQCWLSVDRHLKPGQIITFHDSIKAAEKLRYVLPRLIGKMKSLGYVSLALEDR